MWVGGSPFTPLLARESQLPSRSQAELDQARRFGSPPDRTLEPLLEEA